MLRPTTASIGPTDTRVWTQLKASLADADVACDSSAGADYRCHMDTGLEARNHVLLPGFRNERLRHQRSVR